MKKLKKKVSIYFQLKPNNTLPKLNNNKPNNNMYNV